jgi:hypothetical protein
MPVSELNEKTHLQQLKNGVLLVQLPNSDKKIKILRERGNEKLAKKEEKEINNIRKNIIEGFQNHWDFSEILFFESENAREVFNRNIDFLFDSEMKPIKEFPEKFKHIYSVRYGPGNPNGEVYRYNGVGFQIRYVNNGELQTIKYDTFYHWKFGLGRIRLFFKSLRKNPSSLTIAQIIQFNLKLKKIRIEKN